MNQSSVNIKQVRALKISPIVSVDCPIDTWVGWGQRIAPGPVHDSAQGATLLHKYPPFCPEGIGGTRNGIYSNASLLLSFVFSIPISTSPPSGRFWNRAPWNDYNFPTPLLKFAVWVIDVTLEAPGGHQFEGSGGSRRTLH